MFIYWYITDCTRHHVFISWRLASLKEHECPLSGDIFAYIKCIDYRSFIHCIHFCWYFTNCLLVLVDKQQEESKLSLILHCITIVEWIFLAPVVVKTNMNWWIRRESMYLTELKRWFTVRLLCYTCMHDRAWIVQWSQEIGK